jgi:catechol 2,3-dioxygenase-like lactoylglutathione lyase family enzyme
MKSNRRLKTFLWIMGIALFTYVNIIGYADQLSVAFAESLPNRVIAVYAPGITVSDMDQSMQFYSHVLKFKKISDVEVKGTEYEHLMGIFGLRTRVVRMRLGNEFFVLTEYLTPKGKPVPVDSRSNDRWFQHIAIIVSDMDKAYEWLRKNNVEHSSPSPQRLPDWNKNAAGIWAFYFRDPDGHPLEILQFPPDKGDPKWHGTTDDLFLGIDHTAIVVGITDKSLEFYRDILGFNVAGESLNYGIEQERLNNVFGARLRITGLKGESGPAIEFLEYLTPRDGRSMPLDEKPNDLIHWQTTLVTNNLEALSKKLEENDYNFISTGIVEVPDKILGFKRGLMVRGPDGHVMQVVEK